MQEHKPQSVPNLYCRTKRRTHEQEDGARKATKKIKTAQTLRSQNTVTRSSQLRYHRPRVPEQHTIALLLLVLRGKSPHKLERGKKSTQENVNIKIVQPLFFVFTLYFSCADNRKKLVQERIQANHQKGGKKIKLQNSKEKKKCTTLPAGGVQTLQNSLDAGNSVRETAKVNKKKCEAHGGLFVGGVCAP